LEIELISKIGILKNKTGPLTNLTICGDGGDTMSGRCHSNETKIKIGLAHKGKQIIYTDSWRKNIGNAGRGKKRTQETKDKISKSNTGRVFTDEWKNKISKARKGQKMSEETKSKLRIYMANRILSDEVKAKISEKLSKIHKGKILSQETRKKISIAHTGKIVSEETKAKLRGKIPSKETLEKMRIGRIKKYIITDPDNNIIVVNGISGIYEFFKRYKGIRSRSVYDTLKTKIPYKGWIITIKGRNKSTCNQ